MADSGEALAAPLSETDFQVALWQVLAKQVALYTMGESSSLPEYDALRLLESACFVLGIDPDNPDPTALQAIAVEGVEAAFEQKLRRIEADAARTQELWKDACLNMPLLESVALKDTLESLRDFKARYEPRFFAHEIPADIDYPLCFPVSESLQGVDYINVYLERLLVECRFLRLFDVEVCRHLLRSIHPAYGELILNLFEPVAVNAVGCALAECDVRALCVDDAGRDRIVDAVKECTPRHLRSLLEDAADRACESLKLRESHDLPVRAYVRDVATALVPRVRNALRHDSLAGVFLP